jgi:FKBP-type peptidyl-prolyl cis-trans isomerase SlyD
MQAEKDHVVLFHYRVFERGATAALESSHDGGTPLATLLGHGGLIAGLEKALHGRAAAEAYGELREGFTQRVAKKYFRDGAKLKPGMRSVLQTNQGPRLVTVVKVGASVIDVDLNHPMAGKDLRFEVEIVDVRPATPEELAHGHVHGPGGHQH